MEERAGHIITINENIRLWREFSPFELSYEESPLNSYDSKRSLARLGFNKERIAIKDRWFDVLTHSELVRKRNNTDGYYRALYIQINWDSGEYYIGKVNRPKWSELTRYQGSGLKFVNKLKSSKGKFVRYYIASCKTAEETEQLEATIVDQDLLADEKCLNLVAGGGGTTKHPSVAETSEKKRQYMKSHPEQFKPMLEAARKAFRSGDTPALRERSRRIKEVMSTEEYRKMSADRIKKWMNDCPLEYAAARRKNHEAVKSKVVQDKRKASLKKYLTENPEKHAAWEKNRLQSLASKESKERRKTSLKNWRDRNPEEAEANAQKRAKAAAVKLSKEVLMIELRSGKVLKKFESQHAAAKWLVENGIAKNMNCVSSISSVCLRKPCTTGYGYRKKAYGYGWRFAGVPVEPRSDVGLQYQFPNFDL
ncbi:MAG: hypothetical protein IPJ71_12545 [Bdellovibrionales bacterium]|nr:hypothetical protein [Bdellovibrionales bacterium]